MATFATYSTPSQHAFSSPYQHSSLNTPFQSLVATVPQTPLLPEELVSTEIVKDVVVEDKGINSEELGKVFKLYKDCRRLYASRNFIEGLPLNTPKFSLHTVDLSNNSLNTLNGFEILVNLAYLNVAENNISSTWGLNANTKLVELHISRNSIRLIEGLERLKKLKVVDFSHNRIKTYSDVRALSLNRSLSSVSFRGNVLATYSNFKVKVLHLFPGVAVVGDMERSTANDVHQRHLDMIEDGGRNSAIGRVVDVAEHENLGQSGGKKRGPHERGDSSSPDKKTGYHAMATIAMKNAPDERTRGGLSRSAHQSPGGLSVGMLGLSGHMGSVHGAAFSQFGHGSGSKVTALNVTSSARRSAAKARQQGLIDDKDRFAMKPLPWRQPPAPQPHVTRRVSVVLDDAREGSRAGESSANFEEDVWWTPSRYKEGGANFQPMPNQPDAKHQMIDAARGGTRGRDKRARDGASFGGAGQQNGGGRAGRLSHKTEKVNNYVEKGMSTKGSAKGSTKRGGRVGGGKSASWKGGVGGGSSGMVGTPGKQARKYKVTLGMSSGHHMIGTPSHGRHTNEKPVIWAKPVSKSLVNAASTPKGRYRVRHTGEEISMAPDTGGRSLFGKSVYQYAESVYGSATKREGERGAIASPVTKQIGGGRGDGGKAEEWVEGRAGGREALQKMSLLRGGGYGSGTFGGAGLGAGGGGGAISPAKVEKMVEVGGGGAMGGRGTGGGSDPHNPTVMEVRMKQIGGGGITLDDRLVEVLKVMVKNKKQGIQDIG
ncbi:hypothetical protein TrCOL_g9139 [Triparma columacea]|uniref:Uncharacterized protein n=1 Tax=Triparma columacea TaxID=722753 RepID=A0A9W7LAG0_9STRA|nr:hypothetical protein TrCOL_g9139 [Triparma columacea]